MLRYVLKRVAAALPLMLGVATLIFVLLETAPGNPADLMLRDNPVPPEVRERVERAYGFDRPPIERYINWMTDLCFEGNLGWSHSRSRPVTALLREALPPTLLLAGSALVLHVLVGILLGVVSAMHRDRWPDRALTVGSLLLYGMPTFWLGLMTVLLLSYVIPLFPASSMYSVGVEDLPLLWRVADRAWHLALPAAVLGIASAAAMTRFVRAGLLETLGREFVRSARARGVGSKGVLLRHALRNALLPVINLIGLSLPILFSGSLVIEVVFAWPGMGRLTYDAIRAQDVSVVLAATMMAAGLVVVGNLLADLAMAAVDPRIRLAGRSGR